MTLLVKGQPTRLRAGDVMCVDVHNETVHFEREGELLSYTGFTGKRDEKYWMLPSEGPQIQIFAEILADACGLRFERLGMVGDTWQFRFVSD